MEDIEDIIAPDPPKSFKEQIQQIKIFSNRTERKSKLCARAEKVFTTLKEGIPGTQSIYLKTWGCPHNSSDSEYMAGQLAAEGYTLSTDKLEADLWVLNSCTVKGPSQQHFLSLVAEGQKLGKFLVLAGCVPSAQRNMQQLEGLSVIGVQQIDRIVHVVQETLKGHSVRLLGAKRSKIYDSTRGKMVYKRIGGAALTLPKIRKNALVEIISINTGCLNACTYCKTKHARGDLASYSPSEILQRIQSVIREEGVKEIWLTSEDVGAYGRDIGTDIAQLLESVVKVLPSSVMLRVGMTNPPYIMQHLPAIAKVLNHPNVYSFLHIPVQSGANSVLEEMKRTYTVEEFCKVVDYIKEKVPTVQIATDIICGFPTETETDFEDTIKLCEKYKFPKLHISQFYPRPGTPAAMMKKLPTFVVKQRSRRLTRVFESYLPFEGRENSMEKILVTEVSDDGHWVGRTGCYEKVLVPIAAGDGNQNCDGKKGKKRNLMGKFITVRIVKTSKFCMFGEVVELKRKFRKVIFAVIFALTIFIAGFAAMENL